MKLSEFAHHEQIDPDSLQEKIDQVNLLAAFKSLLAGF